MFWVSCIHQLFGGVTTVPLPFSVAWTMWLSVFGSPKDHCNLPISPNKFLNQNFHIIPVDIYIYISFYISMCKKRFILYLLIGNQISKTYIHTQIPFMAQLFGLLRFSRPPFFPEAPVETSSSLRSVEAAVRPWLQGSIVWNQRFCGGLGRFVLQISLKK